MKIIVNYELSTKELEFGSFGFPGVNLPEVKIKNCSVRVEKIDLSVANYHCLVKSKINPNRMKHKDKVNISNVCVFYQ